MKKGRLFKGLAMSVIAVMALGCFSASNTSARTSGWTDHVDIRTNAAFINDGNQSGLTITKDNISSVQYKTSETNGYVDLYEHNDKLVNDGRIKYETKFGSENYGADLFKVADESVVVRITGTFSNGETFDVEIDQNSTYPDNTYIECKNTSNSTEAAMKHYGAKVEKLTINGKKTDYYNVSNVSIINVAVAMCNGVSYKNNKVVPCGTDFYLNPDIIMILGNQDELTVTKNWTNMEGSLVPSKIVAELYKDGKATGKTVTLSADNEWTSVIKYTRDENSKYTVVENSIEINGETYTPEAAGYTAEAHYATVDGIEIIDTSKTNIVSGTNYCAEFASNLFAVNKMKDKDLYVIWTYNSVEEEDYQAFIDAINAKGEITGLTIDNCVFCSGAGTSYTYTVPGTPTEEVSAVQKFESQKIYKDKKSRDSARQDKINELTANNSDTYWVEIQSYKSTGSGKERGFEIKYVIHTIKSNDINKKLTFELKTNYQGLSKAIAFNYQDKSDWEYLYKGRVLTGTDYTRMIIDNTFSGPTVIFGSKTFDMQGVENVEVPVDENGNPKITLNVTNNGTTITDYEIQWKEDESVANKWNFSILGNDITIYCDTNENGKYDTISDFAVSEAGVSESGVINIDGNDYFVTESGNDITNTLDTSNFTGDLTIVKTIDDVNLANGQAIFTYRIDPLFEGGKSYYAAIIVDPTTHTGSTTLKKLKIGQYKVTELDTMRFAFGSVDPEGGVVKVIKDDEVTASFYNTLEVRENFSHTDLTVNHFVKESGVITTTTTNNDDPIVQREITILTPAFR